MILMTVLQEHTSALPSRRCFWSMSGPQLVNRQNTGKIRVSLTHGHPIVLSCAVLSWIRHRHTFEPDFSSLRSQKRSKLIIGSRGQQRAQESHAWQRNWKM